MNRKHTSVLLVVLLLLGALVVATAAAEGQTPTAPIVPNSPETEPNNDLDTATYIDWNAQRHGTINPAGDVDFFSISESRFASFVVDFYKPATSPVNAVLGLYDWQGNLLAEQACTTNGPCLAFVLTDWSDRFLRVSDASGAGGSSYEYRITLRHIGYEDPNEPNDFVSEATPIVYEENIPGIIEPCGDVEYFTFTGTAGDVIRIDKSWWYVMQLLDANQNILDESGLNEYVIELSLPETGTYYLNIKESDYCNNQYDFRVNLIDRPVYISFSQGGTIKGIPFTSGDVLRYWLNSGQWEMFIDMSDLGLKGNLTALGHKNQCGYEAAFVFGFANKYSLVDVGTVLPQDLVQFLPESLGADTAGEISFYLDGSDIGLTTVDERIDAVGLECWYVPFLSTVARARVPKELAQMNFQDEDLMQVNLGSYGTDTSGSWYLHLDGSVYGLGAADIVGTDVGSDDYELQGDHIWLSFDRNVNLGGITVAPGDIVDCFDSWNDNDDLCDSFAKFFDASDAGVGAYKIDAFEVGEEQ